MPVGFAAPDADSRPLHLIDAAGAEAFLAARSPAEEPVLARLPLEAPCRAAGAISRRAAPVDDLRGPKAGDHPRGDQILERIDGKSPQCVDLFRDAHGSDFRSD